MTRYDTNTSWLVAITTTDRENNGRFWWANPDNAQREINNYELSLAVEKGRLKLFNIEPVSPVLFS